MAGPFSAREREVLSAIADTLVARTNLLPQSTLSMAAPSGTSVLDLVSASGFGQRGYAHFFDDTGEAMAPIGSIASSALTLDYAGYANHGFTASLSHTHNVGAIIATNLMLHRPVAIGPMLRLGLPVIAMWPRLTEPEEFSVGSTLSPITVRIQTHRSLMQFDSDPMDPEAYNEIQQSASRDDVTTIINALNQNRHLMARYNSPGQHAQGLGDGRSKRFARAMWDVVTEAQGVDIPQAVAAIDVIIRPRRFIREEPGS